MDDGRRTTLTTTTRQTTQDTRYISYRGKRGTCVTVQCRTFCTLVQNVRHPTYTPADLWKLIDHSRIVVILLQKSNDVLQTAHQPLTINKREGEGGMESGKTLQRTNVVANKFNSNDVASNNFLTRSAQKSKTRYVEWYNELVPFYVRYRCVQGTGRWVPGNNEEGVNAYGQVTWGTWSLVTRTLYVRSRTVCIAMCHCSVVLSCTTHEQNCTGVHCTNTSWYGCGLAGEL